MPTKNPIIFVIITLFLFTTCKKGEDDPTVSLRTRKARLSGEWRLVKGSASYTTDGYNESYSFDGSNVKVSSTLYYPFTGKYLLGLIISKDGTFSFREVLLGQVLDVSGTWNFNSGMGETKKKEEIVFSIDKVKSGYTGGNALFNRFSSSFVYKIKELRNKKLVINSAGKVYSDSKGRYFTLSTDYIFQQ